MSDDWPAAGTLLAARYRLVTLLETGGMAEVWRADDELLGRPVAVKLPTGGQVAWREARMAAKLQHPGIAAVHDYREAVRPDGTPAPFVVMELLAGESVAAHLEDEKFSLAEAARIGAAVADALAAAHANGVIHRDIKPGNVMLTPNGVKILDFGISAAAGEPDEDDTGATFGTPAYVAPERLDGMPAVPATDVYGVGVLLFEMVTGDPPYPVDTWEELAEARAKGPGRLPEELPAAFRDLVGRCLDDDPSGRPEAEQVRFDLTALWLSLSETYAGKQPNGEASEGPETISGAPAGGSSGRPGTTGVERDGTAGREVAGVRSEGAVGTAAGGRFAGARSPVDGGAGENGAASGSGWVADRGTRPGAGRASEDGGPEAQPGAGRISEDSGGGAPARPGMVRAAGDGDGRSASGPGAVDGERAGAGWDSVPEQAVPDRVGDGPRVAAWPGERAGFARGRAPAATVAMEERPQPTRRKVLSLTLVALLVAVGGAFALINWRPNRTIEAGPDPAAPASAGTPSARVFETPSPAPSTTSASPSPTPSATPRLTFADAISRMRTAVKAGADAGEIRSDVATDLLNLLRNLTGAQGRDVEQQVDQLRRKLQERTGEGSLTPARATVLRARLADVDRAAGT